MALELSGGFCVGCEEARAHFLQEPMIGIQGRASDVKKISQKYYLSWDCRMCMAIRRAAIENNYMRHRDADSPGHSIQYNEDLECEWKDLRQDPDTFKFQSDIYGPDGRRLNLFFARWDAASYLRSIASTGFSDLAMAPSAIRIHEDESTFSPLSLEIAKGWINQCDKHESCCSMAFDFYPTRLLDLSSRGLISVVDGAKPHQHTKYAALSYSWGEGNHTKLLRSNYNFFKRGVDVNTLSQTLKDAIRVTKALGLPYLWVDALCIIQDDHEDWSREAPLMHGVYRGSYINISATASADVSEGLFSIRPSWWCTPAYTYIETTSHDILFERNRPFERGF
ncbi:hypothetical protein LSUE1_G009325 [Lachnellula suecica]|uniref:Heterokaryon incompatibility domain-containing protein n=1 Tax=Lachnellula suecica TaxID=602035 RepID=A0A8T9BW54_9HELO|nr:hypothetical protein LSUE1_G009325 [Lachnellula suecica]